MNNCFIRVVASAGLIAAGLAVFGHDAHAGLTVSSVVGGAPTGVNYANFDDLPLGAGGGVSGGITVSFRPDGQAVTGASSGLYAAPFISNSNGVPFGDNTVSGQDTTTYLTTGVGAVILQFSGLQQYLGLLWGSVDDYNTLSFYNGAEAPGNLVGVLTGLDIDAAAGGDQGANGTFYVNINSDLAFDRVVATSSQYAFEFDNVAYNATPVVVPEPSNILAAGIAGLMLLGHGVYRSRRRLQAAA